MGRVPKKIDTKKGKTGCLIVALAPFLLGLGLIVGGLLAGDTTGYNRRTGQSSKVSTVLYIVGGVFGGIGALALVVFLLPERKGQQEGPRKGR